MLLPNTPTANATLRRLAKYVMVQPLVVRTAERAACIAASANPLAPAFLNARAELVIFK